MFPVQSVGEYKRRKIVKTNFFLCTPDSQINSQQSRVIHLISNGHAQFRKNKHARSIKIHTFCDKKNLYIFLVRLLKPQNGIFVDLGNIIPFNFPLKIAPSGLLQINKKGVDFVEWASALLFCPA